MKTVTKKRSRIQAKSSQIHSVTRVTGGRTVASFACTPSKESVIEMIERVGVAAVYPQHANLSIVEMVAVIRAMPDTKWYPAHDLFWQQPKGEQA